MAISIFLVALVGGAALLAEAKRSEFDSYQRTMATQIGQMIIDRVRTNVSATSLYHRALANPIGGNQLGTTPARDCVALTCSPTELAAYDLWDIEQRLDGKNAMVGSQITGGLVDPAACIVFTAIPNTATNIGRLRVFVSWGDRRGTSDAAAATATCGSATVNPYRRQVVLDTFVLGPS